MVPESEDSVPIALPRSLFEKIEKRVKQSAEFDSVSSYVIYVLEQLINELEGQREVYSEKDKRDIEKRLRALGYLD